MLASTFSSPMASSPHLIFLFLGLFIQQQFMLFGLSSASNAYIVYMGQKGAKKEMQSLQELHHVILSSALAKQQLFHPSSILYSYNHGFTGFAPLLTESQAAQIADFPGVVRVIPNRIFSLHTTRSWHFLLLNPRPSSGLLSRSRWGDRSIIGDLDTGIWPESASSNDWYG